MIQYDKGNPDDTYKTLIFADGDLSLNVIDGNIGSVSGNAGSIDSLNINYRDSINVNVKGDIDIYADNENRTDPRIVNIRAKESDLNLSSVWVNGDVILSAPDWKQGDSADPTTPDYYKGYSILNNSDDPLNGIVARNLTLISSDKIGTADKKLDYTQISNGIASFEAENDINMNMFTLDDGATLQVKDLEIEPNI